MADLYFDPEADRTLTTTDADSSRVELATRLNDALLLLEESPTDPRVRRRRFQIGLWGIPVSGSGEDWIILWEPHRKREDSVVIHYVRPASFA